MLLEGVRIVADWLGDGTDGVNALLSTTSRDVGDAIPPNVAAIEDETRHGKVARRTVPADQTTPALWLFANNVLNVEPMVMTEFRRAEPELVVGYVGAQELTEEGLEDASYTLRTVLRSIHRLTLPANAASRLRNGVGLERVAQARWFPPFTPLESGTLTLGVGLRLVLRDNAPT